MCGILGVVATSPVNQLLYDGLMVLQHRGQDAAGITTGDGDAFFMHKGSGLVRDVFRTRNMRALPGNMGIAHCRYPTAGSSSDSAESQPFYVNSPFGLVLAHNGNLTNTEQLQEEMFRLDRRHINTSSDSEVLLNVLAHEMQAAAKGFSLDLDTIFSAVAGVHRRCKGAYAVVVLIAGYGLLAFRDPNGIRPMVVGTNQTPQGTEYLVASESVALDTLGFKVLRDVEPGEAIFIDTSHQMHARQCAQQPSQFAGLALAQGQPGADALYIADTVQGGAQIVQPLLAHGRGELGETSRATRDLVARPRARGRGRRVGIDGSHGLASPPVHSSNPGGASRNGVSSLVGPRAPRRTTDLTTDIRRPPTPSRRQGSPCRYASSTLRRSWLIAQGAPCATRHKVRNVDAVSGLPRCRDGIGLAQTGLSRRLPAAVQRLGRCTLILSPDDFLAASCSRLSCSCWDFISSMLNVPRRKMNAMAAMAKE